MKRLLLLALSAAPTLGAAQGDLAHRPGLQVTVDHFKPVPGGGLGTNVGVGLRLYNTVTENLHGYMTTSVFQDLGSPAGFLADTYVEGIVSLMYSPRGVDQGAAPYFGAGGVLLVAGVETSGSPIILAGVNFIGRGDRIPFVELQYTTRGGRISAIFGVFF